MTSARQATGRRAEELAAELFESRGAQVIARNWRRPEGELDLVVLDGRTLVFVEVRSRRRDDMGHPLETVTPRKRGRVVRAARLYLDAEPRLDVDGYRFDVVGVLFTGDDDAEAEISYVENAFELS